MKRSVPRIAILGFATLFVLVYLHGKPVFDRRPVGEGETRLSLLRNDAAGKKGPSTDRFSRTRLFEEDPLPFDPTGVLALVESKLRSMPPISPPMQWPDIDMDDVCPVRCSARRITSVFSSFSRHPIRHLIRAHQGIDCAAPYGTPVFATAAGRIAFAGRRGAYGRLIVIDHDDGWSTWYGHLSKIDARIRKGVDVIGGETIGRVGASGLASGPHLHFETRTRDRATNPVLAALPRPLGK